MGNVVTLVDLESRCISYRDSGQREVCVRDLMLSCGIFSLRESMSVYLCRDALIEGDELAAGDIEVAVSDGCAFRGVRIQENNPLLPCDLVVVMDSAPLLTVSVPTADEYVGQINYFTIELGTGNVLLDLKPKTLSTFSPSIISVQEAPAELLLPMYGRKGTVPVRQTAMIEGLLEGFCFRMFNELDHQSGAISDEEIEIVAYILENTRRNYRQMKRCLEGDIMSLTLQFGTPEGREDWRDITKGMLMRFFDMSFEELKMRVAEAALRYRLRGMKFNREYPLMVT